MNARSMVIAKSLLVAGVAAVAMAPSAARAVPIAVPNFSFESPAQADGTQSAGVVPGFTFQPNGGTPNPAGYGVRNPAPAEPAQPPLGDQYALIEDAAVTGGGGPYFESVPLAVSTAIGQLFTATVDVATSTTNQNTGIFFTIDSGGGNFAPVGVADTFVTRADSFVSTAVGQVIAIGLYRGNSGGTVYYDNLRLDGPAGTALPEPAALSLTVVAAATLALRRRR